MQDSFASKRGADSYDDLTDGEKRDFWIVYDNYADRDSHMDKDEWVNFYQDNFDLDYADLYEFPDGETP